MDHSQEPPEHVDCSDKKAVLHLLCGRIAAGKTTLAKSLARRYDAILIGEDQSLQQLYPSEIINFEDYRQYSERLKGYLQPQCVELLSRGVSLVLDFPANTPNCRRWLQQIYRQAEARHLLHYVATPTAQCKKQLLQRIEQQGANVSPIALEQFDEINQYFVPPSVEEGFNVEINR
jgi:predicted kinase